MKNKERKKIILVFLLAIGIILYIGFVLSDFYGEIQKRVYSKQIENMKELSMQGSAVVEKKLEGFINTLYGLAEYLHEEEITDASNIKRLNEFLTKKEIGFQRMGIADEKGNARITNGQTLDISDREYFQTCMKEKRGTSEIRHSELIDRQICIIAVPILNNEKESMGVIYGVVETGVFNIYENTILEDEEQYIQVVDLDGKYILKEESSLIGKRENIFDGINSVKSQKSAEEIKELIQNEEQVYTEITDGGSHEIAYFTPLKLIDWCVVTVVDYSEVTDEVKYILGNDAYIMVLKVIGVIFLLFLMIIYHFWMERKRIRTLNEKLILDERIVQIASEKTGFAILSYEIKSKQLRFIGNTLLDMEFPKQIDNAPVEFMKYVPDDEMLKEQIRKIFISMEQDRGKREFPLAFVRNGEMIYLNLQLTTMEGQDGEARKCIGVLEDDAEEQQLRDKADRDPLTGLYNRGRAIEEIEKYLASSELSKGVSHVYMILDVDNFKILNDTLGHQMGDKALLDVAEILKHHFREYDILCRLGGDEFLVFMKNIPEKAVCRNVTSLLKKLKLTYSAEGVSVEITASAGVALVSDLTMSFQEMYRRADTALYQVKKDTKNSFHIYEKQGQTNE